MPENSILAKTEITIQDYNNNKPVIFSNLTLSESLMSVNSFSFTIRPANDEGTLNAIINFKKEVLGKEVTLGFGDGETTQYRFKGIILGVSSSLLDEHFYEFEITGCGLFAKVNELPQCRSFYKKSLDDIISAVFKDSSLKSNVTNRAQYTKALHYTVQYNQTAFGFIASLATRFGEWMFYDGEKLQFGKKPEGTAIELTMPGDISNLNLKAQVLKKPKGLVSTDIFKSDVIEASASEPLPDNPAIKAAGDSGSTSIEDAPRNFFIPSGFSQEVVNDKLKLEQQAIHASAVYITGSTRNTMLGIGKIIKIKDAQDTSGKSYLITQVHHTAAHADNYLNRFTAVPLDVPVPPYTNPLLITKATAQAAMVTDNEDDAGLARVKVKFPWMAADEKSPWISVLAPHAGRDKGFRFLPEKDDEVMVDFWDGNVETPFVNGAVYTSKNTPGIAESGNHIKMIGSRSGRSLLIDDQEGTFSISDGGNSKDKGKNLVKLTDNKDSRSVKIVSGEDGDNHYAVILDYKGKNATFYCQEGGKAVLNITFDAEKKQMYIFSEDDMNIRSSGSVTIEAKKDISFKANGNINCKADGNIKIDAVGDAETAGVNIKMKASAKMAAEGAMTEIKGAKLDLSGSGIASLQGGLVKIN